MPAEPGSRLHRRPVRFRRGISGGFRGGEIISIRTKRNCSSWALGAGARDRGDWPFGRTAGPRDRSTRPDLFGVDDSTAPRTGPLPDARQDVEANNAERGGRRGSVTASAGLARKSEEPDLDEQRTAEPGGGADSRSLTILVRPAPFGWAVGRVHPSASSSKARPRSGWHRFFRCETARRQATAPLLSNGSLRVRRRLRDVSLRARCGR